MTLTSGGTKALITKEIEYVAELPDYPETSLEGFTYVIEYNEDIEQARKVWGVSKNQLKQLLYILLSRTEASVLLASKRCSFFILISFSRREYRKKMDFPV